MKNEKNITQLDLAELLSIASILKEFRQSIIRDFGQTTSFSEEEIAPVLWHYFDSRDIKSLAGFIISSVGNDAHIKLVAGLVADCAEEDVNAFDWIFTMANVEGGAIAEANAVLFVLIMSLDKEFSERSFAAAVRAKSLLALIERGVELLSYLPATEKKRSWIAFLIDRIDFAARLLVDIGRHKEALSKYALIEDLVKQSEWTSESTSICIMALISSRKGDVWRVMADLHKALNCYKICEALIHSMPIDNHSLQWHRGNRLLYLDRIGDIHSATGNLEEAAKYFTESNEIANDCEFDADDPMVVINRSVALLKLAEITDKLSRTDETIKLLEQASMLSMPAFDKNRRNEEFLDFMGVLFEKKGDAFFAAKDMLSAIRAHQDCLELRKELCSRIPGSAKGLQATIAAYIKIGMDYSEIDDEQKSANAYHNAYDIWLDRRPFLPRNYLAYLDWSFLLLRLTEIAEKSADVDSAWRYAKDAYGVANEGSLLFRGNARIQMNAVSACMHAFRLCGSQGEMELATDYMHSFRLLHRNMVEHGWKIPDYIGELVSMALQQFGEVVDFDRLWSNALIEAGQYAAAEGRNDDAMRLFERGSLALQELVENDPINEMNCRNFADACIQFGLFHFNKNSSQSSRWFYALYQIILHMEEHNMLLPEALQSFKNVLKEQFEEMHLKRSNCMNPSDN